MEGKREKYIDTIKEQVKLKNVLQVFLIGLIGYIMGVVSVFYVIFRNK